MNPVERRLSELVHERPNLYDQSRRDYKDSVKGHAAWKEVAHAMGKSEEEVKLRWKNLRDKFCKAKKRRAMRSGPLPGDEENGMVERPAPALLHQLAWLSDFVKPRLEAVTETGSGEDTEKEKIREKEQLVPLPVVSNSFSYAEPCPSDQQELRSGPKSKRQRKTDSELSCAEGLGSVRDEDELFLLSLLPSLKRLTIRKRMEVRMKFQQVLYAAEFEDEGTKKATKSFKVDAVV